jgi:hypothetical protein
LSEFTVAQAVNAVLVVAEHGASGRSVDVGPKTASSFESTRPSSGRLSNLDKRCRRHQKIVGLRTGADNVDGTDKLTSIEMLRFDDAVVVIGSGK